MGGAKLIEVHKMRWGPPEQSDLFSHVSLALRSGERAFLTGDSGTGKSTLLRLIVMLEGRR